MKKRSGAGRGRRSPGDPHDRDHQETCGRRSSALYPLTLLLLLLLFCVVSACRRHEESSPVVSDAQAAAILIREADQLYAERSDLKKVRQGIIQLRQALTADYRNYEAAWRLAKYNYYLGAHTPDEAERDRAFREGVEAGKLAVQLQDGRPEGHFWLGANYGGGAQTGLLAGLSSIEDIRREMETVMRLDPTYQGASAYMVLGQVYLEAPQMLGGDDQKAVEVMEQGLQYGGDNALLHLRLAEAYTAVKREREARQQIDLILRMKPHPDYLPEYQQAVEGARALQARLK